MPKRQPQCYIIAGPNGAGKTAFAREFLPRYVYCMDFVNPDLIAQGLSPFDPTRAAPAAGRLVSQRIHDLAQSRTDFAMETTLAGRTYVPFLRTLKIDGYGVNMFYLWLPSPAISISRIAYRVKQGGHNVPAADVRRRFRWSLGNLFSLYYLLLDALFLFDSSGVEPHLIFEDVGGFVRIDQPDKYEKIMKGIKS